MKSDNTFKNAATVLKFLASFQRGEYTLEEATDKVLEDYSESFDAEHQIKEPMREDLQLVDSAKEKGFELSYHVMDQDMMSINSAHVPKFHIRFKKDDWWIWWVGYKRWCTAKSEVTTYNFHEYHQTLSEAIDRVEKELKNI